MISRQGDRFLVEGPVTLDNVASLLDESAALHEADAIVDLSGITAVDSSALSLMVEWTRRSRAGGKRISFANAGPNLHSLAELYGVVDLVPFAT